MTAVPWEDATWLDDEASYVSSLDHANCFHHLLPPGMRCWKCHTLSDDCPDWLDGSTACRCPEYQPHKAHHEARMNQLLGLT